MIEKWKDIEDFEGKYQVSNTGKVRSINYNNTNQSKLLKIQVSKKGYNRVNLWKGNKCKQYSIGLLVARAFLEKENENFVVTHIGDRSDDNVKNLKWVSQSVANLKKNKSIQAREIEPIYTKNEINEYKKIANDNNISTHQMYKRLYEGWDIDEAINIPMNRKERILRKRLYEYKDKLYSVKQLAEISEHKITDKTIYKRLARGWTVEESVEIPLAGKKGK